MDVKKITKREFINTAAKYPFNIQLLTKDYFLTLLLYNLRNVKDIYFKGGTALQKNFS